MKAKILIVSLILTGILTNCTKKALIPKDMTKDSRFVGVWTGEEINKENIKLRTWTQTRKKNGRYTIIMVLYDNGIESKKEKEKGYWWTEKDIFFEFNPKIMLGPDKYKFEILSDKEIRFSAVKLDATTDLNNSEQNPDTYSFIDRKIK